MKIQKKKTVSVKSIEGIVIPVFQKTDIKTLCQRYPDVQPFIKRFRFQGKIGDRIVFNSRRYDGLIMVLGAGNPGEPKDAAKSARHVISELKAHLVSRAAVHFVDDERLPAGYLTNFIDFLFINNYRFDAYLSTKEKREKIKKIQLVFESPQALGTTDIENRELLNRSVLMARDMVNEVPEKVNPDSMVAAFRDVAAERNLSISVMRRKELEDKEMKGILSVAKGSPYEPALVRVEYRPPVYKKTVTLVGKGITFDSGGLNIKVGNYMEEMKCDMAGAATVLGILRAASDLKIPVRLITYGAIAENMPGQQAYKPGDIISYKNKKSVEVVNTDAEGRLILADALIEAASEKPDYMVEFSTLTGAILIALGDMIAGLMTTHPGLSRNLVKAGEQTSEFLWPLPMPEEYRESIKSKIATLKNANYKWGSSIKAGLFLNEFSGKAPFAHIDVAGTAFISQTHPFYLQEGATGFGIRLMVKWLENMVL